MHLQNHLKTLYENAYQDFARALIPSDQPLPPLEVMAASRDGHGDYQINNAMRLAKMAQMSPKEVGERLAAALPKLEVVERLEVAGPGFINIHLAKTFLEELAKSASIDQRFGCERAHRERIVVDFSSPNVAKEMHVGHLRSTILGDCIARLFEFLGDDVLRLNHVGDFGTQFGMLIAYILEKVPTFVERESKSDGLKELLVYYKAAKVAFDQSEAFRAKAHDHVVALQKGEALERAIWTKICEISRRGYEEIYKRLDVSLEERGESFYGKMLKETVDFLKEKGLVTRSEGAECIFMEGYSCEDGSPLPFIIQKQDGGYNYATTDLAALRHRIEVEKADRVIYVVDLGQRLHLEMLFRAGELAGWICPKIRVDHVGFGVVLGADGKKFKTRSGETEKLSDLLDEAVASARAIVDERSADFPESERAHIAEVVGIDAVKYADLSAMRTKDYTFSYERMLRFEGNTAPFLLYSHVRMQSILRKASAAFGKDATFDLTHPSERALALHLLRFPEVISMMVSDLCPHRLADYLYTLAERFNAFFRDCPVLGNPHEKSRLALVHFAAKLLSKGLSILGLKTLERM